MEKLVLSFIGLLIVIVLAVVIIHGINKVVKFIGKTDRRENVRSEECPLCKGMFAPNYIGTHIHECSSSLCPMPHN